VASEWARIASKGENVEEMKAEMAIGKKHPNNTWLPGSFAEWHFQHEFGLLLCYLFVEPVQLKYTFNVCASVTAVAITYLL